MPCSEGRGVRALLLWQDTRRIKQEGPKLEDVTQSLPFKVEMEDGSSKQKVYKWVPKDVITAAGQYVAKEPEWVKLPQMSYMEFYQVSCKSVCALAQLSRLPKDLLRLSHVQMNPCCHAW